MSVLGTYSECTQCEHANEDCLSLQGELRLEEDGHGNKNNHDIGGNINNSVGDEMVCRSRTLCCKC
jgi:hypothetical protein